MEDASAIDLDWFWRGWFYSTDVVDIGVKNVKKIYFSDKPDLKARQNLIQYEEYLKNNNAYKAENLDKMVFIINEESESFDPNWANKSPISRSKKLQNDINSNVKIPRYSYEVEFEKPGGLVMPLIVKYSYADGSSDRVTYPVQLWRKNDVSVKKVIFSNKELIGVTIDPDLETADVNLKNNSWPKQKTTSEFEKFKAKIKG